ncbi:lysophospholipid acyltransferase LPEAT1-like isoform X1 [Pyrus communis]|uniref:lysophospholipid acyltransferase LPEAT1-like isoform X1 n=1 Tax=Pyrus communis TaxID=23211 RepID=UPI0035C00C4F
MESELKGLNSKPAKQDRNDGPASKDDRPLLKPDPASSVSAEELQELEKKCAAYVRRDVYGTMGRGELPVKEKVLLGLALVTLVPIRVVLAMTVLVLYYLICRICTLFKVPNRDEQEQEDYAHMGGWRQAVIVQCGRALSRAMLFVFGFYWINESYRIPSDSEPKPAPQGKDGAEEKEPERPGAIISNHVSYLDILYHMSNSFPSFVAKRSVAKLPLVGLISKCLGCVYVQRESKSSNFKGVAGAVTERVKEAHQNKSAPPIMLFPDVHYVANDAYTTVTWYLVIVNLSTEGTTTNGDFLLPFKTGAFLAKAPVLPVIIRYPYHRFSPAWDSISGVRHVIFLLCQFVNHIEVTRLPVYYPSQQEKDDPKLYASNVRRLMSHEGNMTLSDIGLAEKRVYHAALNGNNSRPSVLHQKDD